MLGGYPGSLYPSQYGIQTGAAGASYSRTPTQFVRAASDISAGNWTPSTGGTLFATINETPENDSNYDTSGSATASADIMEVKFGSATLVPSTGYLIVRYAYGKNTTGGDIVNLTVRLVQGTTIIASWVHNAIPTGTTVATQQLTSGQFAAISNFTDLRLRFEAVKG